MRRRRALPQTKYYAPLTPKSQSLWVYISSNVVFGVDYDLDIEIAPLLTEDGMLVGI